MNFDSYIISDTKTATTVLPKCPPPYSHKGFNKLKFKKKAFTLAEVLITLTIIGVVAAMTIPTLMSKYQKHQYVVALKKAYSHLQNAVKMIPITEGCPAGDYYCAGIFENPATNIDGIDFQGDQSSKFTYLLSKQFKLRKKFTSPDRSFTTVDGITYYAESFYPATTLGISVDINGPKGPNRTARDKFNFIIATDDSDYNTSIPAGTVIPVGSKLYGHYTNDHNAYWKDITWESYLIDRDELPSAYTGRVLEEDAMNY